MANLFLVILLIVCLGSCMETENRLQIHKIKNMDIVHSDISASNKLQRLLMNRSKASDSLDYDSLEVYNRVSPIITCHRTRIVL